MRYLKCTGCEEVLLREIVPLVDGDDWETFMKKVEACQNHTMGEVCRCKKCDVKFNPMDVYSWEEYE
mgnify:CR=1 FL=1